MPEDEPAPGLSNGRSGLVNLFVGSEGGLAGLFITIDELMDVGE